MMDIVPFNIVQAVSRALRVYQPRLKPITLPSLDAPTDEEKLLNITGKSHDVLFKTRTVFPLDFFTDTITIDREKVSIVNRLFFWTARIISVPVRDILSVQANAGPFFGSLQITSRYYPVNPLSINFLWRKDALRLRRLLQGYIIAHEREIDCSEINREELIYLLYDLGQGEIE